MSDDKKDPKALKGDVRAKSLVDPTPKNEDFCNWLESLFDGPTGFPEKIDTRVVTGKHGERLGPMIKQIIFPPTTEKPKKEDIVNLSNQLLHMVQRDCDMQRRSVVYGVHVVHFSREVDYYERYLIRCSPKGVHAADGPPRGGADGEYEDGEGMPMHERFSAQALGHHERMFSLYGGAFEGIVDRLDRIIERQDRRIETQDATIAKQNETMERALSLQAEREERREWNKLKIESATKAVNTLVSVGPPLLNQIWGKSVIPTSETMETITLKNFFKLEGQGGTLTKDQIDAAFGVYDEKPPHALLTPGILSELQSQLLHNVAHCQAPVDDIDRLLFGGDLEVSREQFMALAQVFSSEQMMPLQILFDGRLKKKMAAASAAGAAAR